MRRKRSKEQSVQTSGGIGGALWEFLNLIADMERKGERMRSVSGRCSGPFGSKMAYDYSVKLGIESGDFPFKRGFNPRPRPVSHVRSIERASVEPEWMRSDDIPGDIEPQEPVQEPVVDVFDEGDCVLIVAQVPYVRDEDIDLKIVDNVLKITAMTSKGRIEKDIPVSDGSRIEDASFKNGVIEIRLNKK